MIIAIDGPAGAGKSTVAQAVARELGLPFLDTGAMYRALTLVVLRRGLSPSDGRACLAVANEVELDFDPAGRIVIDGESGEPAIRGTEVTRHVSALSVHAEVRAAVVARQRELARAWPGLVAEGRDTTTVVFPGADHKFFLIATAGERARRRALQMDRPFTPELVEEVRADIERRDRIDSSRADSPLVQAPDAVVIDGDGLDADGVAGAILEHVRSGEPSGTSPERSGP